jgi:competence protein ComEA
MDLNRAGRAELLQLPGVGDGLAERIETHRRERGPFRRVDDLAAVQGVGPSTLERLRPLLYVDLRAVGNEQYMAPPPAKLSRSSRPSVVPDGDSEDRRISGKKDASPASPIDINRATVEELQRLPGIGPKRSQQIVEERERRPFRTVDDLRRIRGIGPKTWEKLRPLVTVGSSPVRVAAVNDSE